MGAEISYGPNPAGAIGSINKLFKTLNDWPVCFFEGISKLYQCTLRNHHTGWHINYVRGTKQ